ncbi:tolloid-like protein 1 isoform X2 [Folsomia candida]|uniref:tolloid-like protein 1 isoform X2 n=1 Tax=Folsomia candida TaxID=158441 RepID=UPI001604E85F|nr:tolloid-like protein 1 isoform X2 [Folsomia candida]
MISSEMAKFQVFLLLCDIIFITVASQSIGNSSITSTKSIIGVPISPSASSFWPGGVIPYVIDPSFDATDRSSLQQAISDYHKKTCIRWVSRRSNDAAFVRFERNKNGAGCASSGNCYSGGEIVSTFEKCAAWDTMVHEMGHTLCFGHEQSRADRDDFIVSCGQGQYEHLNLGHLYDYRSIMHYKCDDCMKPKMDGVYQDQCGGLSGLSILDAEKLNDIYDCKGCMSYRFRFPHQLNSSSNLVQGGAEPNGDPLYPCRAYIKGDIAPGKSINRGNGDWSCYVSWGGDEYEIKNKEQFEVLTNPRKANLNWRKGCSGSSSTPGNAIAGGRTTNSEPLYVSRCRGGAPGSNALTPAKLHGNSAYYSWGGHEYKCEDFDILVCS